MLNIDLKKLDVIIAPLLNTHSTLLLCCLPGIEEIHTSSYCTMVDLWQMKEASEVAK
jgi:hypothetical protein